MYEPKQIKEKTSRCINRGNMAWKKAKMMDKRYIIQAVRTYSKPESTKLSEEAEVKREQEKVNDLQEEGRNLAMAIFADGKMFQKVFTENDKKEKLVKVNSKVIFVLSTDNYLYIRKEPHGVPRQDGFTHANFLSGNSVKAAGQMFVRDGVITRIDNESGHYEPKDVTLEWVLDFLKNKAVELKNIMMVMLSVDKEHPENSKYQVFNADDYDKADKINDVKPIEDKVRINDEDFQQIIDNESPGKIPKIILNYNDAEVSIKYEDRESLILQCLEKYKCCELNIAFKNNDEKSTTVKDDIITKIRQKKGVIKVSIKEKKFTKIKRINLSIRAN